MAETLLLPVVRGVIGKAADVLVQRVTSMWGIDKDRNKLEDRLVYVSRMLADAEVKAETDLAVKRWMKNLKAVAYQADDVLDHFQYEALRCEVQGRQSKTSKVLSHFTCDNPLLFRLKMSKELKNVLDKIEGLVSDMNKFGLLVRDEVLQVPYHRQTHSALDESAEIIGRDNDKEVVVKLLLDQQDQQSVQVLPIIGMGGLGKTTLAKMVFNDSRVQKQFQLKMWYCVSENFEATAVVRSVIELATNGRCELPDNIELLRGRLQEVLGRKRFLLVLDDVWNEDERKWEDDLKPLLCSSSHGSGSMIVVTSRSQRVASIMGTFSPYKLAYLSEDYSWELFSKKAFSTGVQKRAEFVTIGRRIADKCKGLPLALKTMGGLMSSTQRVQDWVTVADSNISDTSRGKDEVMSVLKLSYKYLSPEMKQCFAFCSIFPKDSAMEKDKLIQLWIANSFIHVEGMKNLTEKGEEIFDELVWRSFLQDVNVHPFPTNGGFFYLREIGCKMHDLMHDLATEVTEECAPAQKSIQEKRDIYHMMISSYKLKENKGLLKSTSHLRTILIYGSIDQDVFEINPMSVRALSYIEPSDSLGKHAKHLRYLDLSGSDIVRLPDSICMIYHLQSLRLDCCTKLQFLPEGMAYSLRKLIHIHLLECEQLNHMPPRLSLLQNLRTLTRFVVGTKDGCGIEELKDLRQLGNRLELYKLENVKSGSKANLHEKQINELVLDWNFTEPTIEVDNAEEVNAEEVLESLVPCHELKFLEVRGYPGRAISQWMRDPQIFQCLTELKISECQKCTDIPIVWLSRSLESLYLADMDNLTTLCKNIDEEAAGSNSSLTIFPSLKSMRLEFMWNLERWAESSAGEPYRSVMFPRLEKLNIFCSPKLVTLPLAPLLTELYCSIEELPVSMPLGIDEGSICLPVSMPLGSWPSLVSLTVGLSANVAMSLGEQQGQSLNPAEALRCLTTEGDDGFGSIFDIPRLQLGLGSALAFVEELEISWCENIVRWPMEEELRYLPRLQSLSICWCTKLGEEGSPSQEILPLPLLKRLTILKCESLLEIPQLPASLEEMEIDDCKSLVALPDGMDGLTSLGRLSITRCPGIEGFPQGLLQRLPALNYLQIRDCPNLRRRCRGGGEYFDLVSSIPEKYIVSSKKKKKHIAAASEPEIKKSVKRFLPFCGGDC